MEAREVTKAEDSVEHFEGQMRLSLAPIAVCQLVLQQHLYFKGPEENKLSTGCLDY